MGPSFTVKFHGTFVLLKEVSQEKKEGDEGCGTTTQLPLSNNLGSLGTLLYHFVIKCHHF